MKMPVSFIPKAYKSSWHRKAPFVSNKVTEKKFRIGEAAAIIGISPSGVRLLLDNKKLGYYQSGKRRIIGENHLNEYLTKIERNRTKPHIS
jgi:excisionase family DNA binding protein